MKAKTHDIEKLMLVVSCVPLYRLIEKIKSILSTRERFSYNDSPLYFPERTQRTVIIM